MPDARDSALSTQHSALARLGLLGGTFDPPHIGHLLLAECARLEFGLDEVAFLPAGAPYRKTAPGVPSSSQPPPRRVSAVEHRLVMTELAIAGNPHFRVDAREVLRPGNTYTVDTLQSMRAECGNVGPDIFLILGSDALADMPYWKTPERLFELATILIARKGPPRPRETATEIAIPAALLSLLRARWSHRVGELLRFDQLPETLPVVSTMPLLPVSSTLIRQRVAASLPVRYLLPKAVESYIGEHGLYGAATVVPGAQENDDA